MLSAFTHLIQFSSSLSLDQLSCLGDKRDDLAQIFFQSFLQEAVVSIQLLRHLHHSTGFTVGEHVLSVPLFTLLVTMPVLLPLFVLLVNLSVSVPLFTVN